MGAHSTTHTHAAGHGHHGFAAGARSYGAVLGALFVLTAITVAASYVNFGSGAINVVVALGIATVKAALVALFFMHLKNDRPINAVIFLSGLLFLALFLGFCLIDVNSREVYTPANHAPPMGGPTTSAPGAAAPAAGQTSATPSQSAPAASGH